LDTRNWLTRAVEILEGKAWVADADLPLTDLIGAADVVHAPLLGSWRVDAAEPLRYPKGRLTASLLAAKYEEVRAEDGREGLPVAEHQTLWWLSRGTAEEADTLLLDAPSESNGVCAQLAFRIERDDVQSLVRPTLLIHARPGQSPASFVERNRNVRRVYEQVCERRQIEPWVHSVCRLVQTALIRLHTRALSPWPDRREIP
jgi:hypothetical protein